MVERRISERVIAVYVPKDLYKKVELEAARKGLSLSAFVRQVLIEKLEGKGE